MKMVPRSDTERFIDLTAAEVVPFLERAASEAGRLIESRPQDGALTARVRHGLQPITLEVTFQEMDVDEEHGTVVRVVGLGLAERDLGARSTTQSYFAALGHALTDGASDD